ncbi:leucine-rich repeat domain-containing protein [Capnocytophaga catalasegens]|uniref:Leucine-rich repeat domain-containing protein n=1 Tax=Capnocytophaga catalasegens TaxID=1004260 RepID=A0AAV5AYC8_9FLAO|nr:leucine-rich repeat domain-containing protein [Capnocytophaga catalasegens]GIZ16507.1 hypothetical protein RCZ03_25070 [Capnocytophaga catalasegens]GJM51435.1 hypothetical protein RCZ15_24080 [Capnocytophaga catalasegens]GJM53173.1 hypothetical protein RCZ16_14900 [Capnocytophaga catalasegens]
MKKHFLHLLLPLVTIIVSNCSKDSTTTTLALEKIQLSLENGQSSVVKITSGSGDYTLKQTDETIAQISISDDKKNLVIKTLKVGNSDISVTDKQSNTTQVLKLTITPYVAKPTDYEVEGTTLKRWKNSNITSLDMQSDPVLSKITAISEDAFDRQANLISIILPNSLTTIGRAAFAKTGLLSIEIPRSVTTISEYAFAESSLTKVTLHEGLTSISSHTFLGTKLISVTIPKGITALRENAFSNCTNLKEITLPETITEIGKKAFEGNTELKTVTIEATNPPTLGEDAFLNTLKLETIYVPKSAVQTYIGSYSGDKYWQQFQLKIKGK